MNVQIPANSQIPASFECGSEFPASVVTFLVECAVLAYKPEQEIRHELESDNCGIEWFEAVGKVFDTQAFACVFENDIVVAFRGTQEIRDFLTDLMAKTTELKGFSDSDTIKVSSVKTGLSECAQVHWGFNRALDGIWSRDSDAFAVAFAKGKAPDKTLQEFLREYSDKKKRIWLCGHSLGGALASVATARLALGQDAPFSSKIAGLVTIGSPRVFTEHTSRAVEKALGEDRAKTDASKTVSKIYRIFRSIDPVPAIPYRPYHHVSGVRSFIDQNARLIVGGSGILRRLDTYGSLLRALEDWVGSALPGQHGGFTAFVADHSSEDYLEAVKTYDSTNKHSWREVCGRILAPLSKLLVPASAVFAGGWGFFGG